MRLLKSHHAALDFQPASFGICARGDGDGDDKIKVKGQLGESLPLDKSRRLSISSAV